MLCSGLSLPRLLQPWRQALVGDTLPFPSWRLLQRFNPAMPALNSRVQVCALPLSCQGSLGESFNLPASNSSELENPFVLSSTARPWHSTRWIKHGLVQSPNQLLPLKPDLFPWREVSCSRCWTEWVAKPGIGLGVPTPKPCPACLDSFPGIGTDGQRHTRVLRYWLWQQLAATIPLGMQRGWGTFQQGVLAQVRRGVCLSAVRTHGVAGSLAPFWPAVSTASLLPWLPVHPFLGAAVLIADH